MDKDAHRYSTGDASGDEAAVGRARERHSLTSDLAAGVLIAIIVVLIVIFASHAEPTFVYQAF